MLLVVPAVVLPDEIVTDVPTTLCADAVVVTSVALEDTPPNSIEPEPCGAMITFLLLPLVEIV